MFLIYINDLRQGLHVDIKSFADNTSLFSVVDALLSLHLNLLRIGKWKMSFNPFSTNVPLLYPRKISENLRFSDVFREYRRGTLVENGLILTEPNQPKKLYSLL